MQTLPRKSSGDMPDSIIEENRVSTLASLSITPELQKLSEVVVSQWQKREILNELGRYGIHPIRNVLLHGPPGNGKTTACQWLAAELNVPLYRVRCDALVNSYLGTTAKSVREALDWLQSAGESVVLFDEIETIFISREANTNNDTLKRELTSAMAILWQSLDRWTSPQLFCFATNLPEQLDKAMLSRFELQLMFGPPTTEQSDSVIEYWQEVFHAYQPETWVPLLKGRQFSSFRELWFTISTSVRQAALGA